MKRGIDRMVNRQNVAWDQIKVSITARGSWGDGGERTGSRAVRGSEKTPADRNAPHQ